jgi:hypothetical protein
VEISKSRVRTPGKPGYGLYRVRGLERYNAQGSRTGQWSDDLWRPTEWTAYAYGLGVIDAAVTNSIQQGRPGKPMGLYLVEDATAVKTGEGGYAGGAVVPTRWTQQYRGRRDLGIRRGASPSVLVVDEGLSAEALAVLHGGKVATRGIATDPRQDGKTVRQRRREQNAAFQVEHKVRRDHGLRARHVRKLGGQ